MAPDPNPSSHADHTGWSDSSARAVLQLMVESVAELVGFEIATMSVLLDGDLVTVAYTGPEEHREYLMNAVDPVSVLDPVLERAESWGRFRFLDADIHQIELEGNWVMLAPDRIDEPDSWHPENVLIGLLSDDDGELVGVLSVDRPVSGRCPGPAQRHLLEKYAAQAERAVLTAFEREELVRQVARAESARRLIRSAAMPAQASLEAVLVHTNGPLLEGFEASGLWVEVFDADGGSWGYARDRAGEVMKIGDDVVDLAREIAPRLWAAQSVFVLGDDATPDPRPGLTADLVDEALVHAADMDLDRALAVPLGAGTECLGLLVLTRNFASPAWSLVEQASALEIGHDVGAAMLMARSLERERALVRELQELDDYRSQLFATLSHELRTPLTVISGNLEIVGGLGLDDRATGFLDAMGRGADRMQKVVDDLMLLARVSHPRHPLARVPIDLRRVTEDVVDLLDSTASSKGLTLDVHLDDASLLVPGDPTELDQLIGNLVSNALKYTPSGGLVSVSLRRRAAEVVIEVADDGLGISEEDQARIFRAFYRTENPEALHEPGTGLGLAIVATVVERHGGQVEVASRLGEGTTFTVTLPAASVP
ncbi:sensor histidine kinase [Nocardioides sp. URHA0020]|uniref:sensor histidine kinase n=1 Tax=Nocardioides sp. URHA0020 TaxID=1380392 RepID=UPI0006842910|nr:ATP-binding protein [Nocardioides sp. URHA0020]